MGNPGWWESQQKMCGSLVHRAFLYTIHFSISCRITESPSLSVLLVANRSTSAWFVAYDLGWSTWKKDANLHPEAISWYIPIYSGYSYIHPEYMGIYHGIFPYIHIVAHVKRQHGMCFLSTSVHVCMLELGPWHLATVCRCSLGFTLISSNQHYYMIFLMIDGGTSLILLYYYYISDYTVDCKYYITICCICIYVYVYIYIYMCTVLWLLCRTVWDGNKRTIHGAPDNHMFLKGPF